MSEKKYLPIAGIDDNNLAKPIKVDNQNNLKVVFGGKSADGEQDVYGASFELDENNLPVLRIIDANPWAYNSATDELKVITRKRTSSKVVIFDNVEKRDKITMNSPIIDASSFSKITILAFSTLDKTLSLNFNEASATQFGRGARLSSDGLPAISIDIPSGKQETIIITSKDWPMLEGPIPNFRLSAHFWEDDAPTTGSFTVVFLYEER